MTHTYFKFAPLLLGMSIAPALAQSDAERLKHLEQQVSSLQQQLTSTAADRVQLNGFLSTGYATASNDAGLAGIAEDSEINDLSLMALQGNFRLSDDTQAVMQFLSRGEHDWNTKLEWAYLSHQLTNDLQVRAGKMRGPLFKYSDSLDVAYAQPWARAPQVIYGLVNNSNFVGADALYTHNLRNSSLTAQVFTGGSDNSKEVELEYKNSIGLNLEWTDYVWFARAIASYTPDITIDTAEGTFADEDRGTFLGLGFGYDDGVWQIISEFARLEVDGVVADTDAAYISLGRRVGNFTPYAVVGWTESMDDDERTGSPLAAAFDTRRDEYSLGVRWDVLSGVAVKFDWTHARGFGDEPGGLDVGSVFANDIESTNIYTVKIDSAF